MHEVLCIELQKDGSDTWRLEPVIELLKQGGVSGQLLTWTQLWLQWGAVRDAWRLCWCQQQQLQQQFRWGGASLSQSCAAPSPSRSAVCPPFPRGACSWACRRHGLNTLHPLHPPGSPLRPTAPRLCAPPLLWLLQLGIIPTDSLPAVVCDLSNKVAALKLYNAMDLAPKKQLSILVGGFNDISTYTTGQTP